jgi:hypothetical protein
MKWSGTRRRESAAVHRCLAPIVLKIPKKNKGKYFKKMAILYSFFREIALKPLFGAAALS